MRSILNEILLGVKENLASGHKIETIKSKLINNGASSALADKIIKIAEIETKQMENESRN